MSIVSVRRKIQEELAKPKPDPRKIKQLEAALRAARAGQFRPQFPGSHRGF